MVAMQGIFLFPPGKNSELVRKEATSEKGELHSQEGGGKNLKVLWEWISPVVVSRNPVGRKLTEKE